MKPANPVLPLVKEVRETTDAKEVATTLASGDWVVIAAALSADETCLFSLGRVN